MAAYRAHLLLPYFVRDQFISSSDHPAYELRLKISIIFALDFVSVREFFFSSYLTPIFRVVEILGYYGGSLNPDSGALSFLRFLELLKFNHSLTEEEMPLLIGPATPAS